jgi:hypothetical protein
MPEPIFMKLGMYIMGTEPISRPYFINSFHQSVYPSYHLNVTVRLSVSSLHLLPGNNSAYTFPRKQRIVGGVVLYAICVVSEDVCEQFFPELLA